MIEVLDKETAETVNQMQFEAEGGPKAVIISMIVLALKWVAIGALIRVGWLAVDWVAGK